MYYTHIGHFLRVPEESLTLSQLMVQLAYSQFDHNLTGSYVAQNLGKKGGVFIEKNQPAWQNGLPQFAEISTLLPNLYRNLRAVI